MSEVSEKQKDLQRQIGALAKASPELVGGFARASKVAFAPGSFTSAQKELMAVAIAVAKGCEACILYHVGAALKHGAKEAELVEALEVAVEMSGGSAIMYGAKALEIMRALQ